MHAYSYMYMKLSPLWKDREACERVEYFRATWLWCTLVYVQDGPSQAGSHPRGKSEGQGGVARSLDAIPNAGKTHGYLDIESSEPRLRPIASICLEYDVFGFPTA